MRDSSWGRIRFSSGSSSPAWAMAPWLLIRLRPASDAASRAVPSLANPPRSAAQR